MNPFTSACDTDPEARWEEKANCKGKAFELFEFQEKDSPLCSNMDYKTRMQFNRVNYELASEICIECPVMFQCIDASTQEERAWTVRGGLMPTRMLAESRRYDNQGRPAKKGSDRVCQRGHVVPGGGRCKSCKRENNDRLQKASRAAASLHRSDGVS